MAKKSQHDTTTKDIKILIACHKQSELPDSNLFLPIHVGAALSNADLGIQRDDDGQDNISTKNPNYCELTAIYWAWKNLDAEYYGLFHYRRFYSFTDTQYDTSSDSHRMVRLGSLSQEVFEKYGLLDEGRMRSIIEANDMIIHQSRKVSRLPTPRQEYGKTLRRHYDLHDGTITFNSDIDLMMSIIENNYPEIAPHAYDYMQGGYYLGYNMFIMRKPLFDGMCEFMFGVLETADPSIDMTYRSQNGRRIHGYLAELLSSIYIYYLRTTRPELKVDERQMLFAERTDPIQDIAPIEAAFPIVFDLASHAHNRAEVFFPVGFQSFLSTVDSKKRYDVLIVHRAMSMMLQKQLTLQAAEYSAVTLRFVDYTVEADILNELSGVSITSVPLLAPWLFRNYATVLLVQWNVLIRSDVSEYAQLLKSEERAFAAAIDVYYSGRMNEQDSDTKKRAERLGINPYTAIDEGVFVMNLAHRRAHEEKFAIVAELQKHSMSCVEWLNKRYAGCYDILPQEWNTRVITSDAMAAVCAHAPADIFKEYQSAVKASVIAQYPLTAPIDMGHTEFTLEFWNSAQQLATYPFMFAAAVDNKKIESRGFRDMIAPVGSRRRRIIKKMFPKKSVQRRIIGEIKRSVLR